MIPQARWTMLSALIVAALAPVPAAASEPAPSLTRPSAQTPAAVAAWLTRYTSIAPDTVVSVGDEYIVAVLSSRAADPAHPRLLSLEIRAELADADAEAAKLLRSLSASLTLNCADHTSHIAEVRTFAGPNLTGTEQVSQPTEGWVTNPAGSYFEDIDKAICTPNGPRPLVLARAEPPRPSAPAPANDRSPPLSLRPPLSADGPPARAASHRAPSPAAPRPPAVTPIAPAHGGTEAQITAAPTEAAARSALASLKAAHPGPMTGLSTRIEKIDRNGKPLYRALVFGFTPPADAAGFCRQIAALGQACLAR